MNWEKYQAIRNLIDKREYNRVKQAEYRSKKKKPSARGQNAESAYLRAALNGSTEEQLSQIVTDSLPEGL